MLTSNQILEDYSILFNLDLASIYHLPRSSFIKTLIDTIAPMEQIAANMGYVSMATDANANGRQACVAGRANRAGRRPFVAASPTAPRRNRPCTRGGVAEVPEAHLRASAETVVDPWVAATKACRTRFNRSRIT